MKNEILDSFIKEEKDYKLRKRFLIIECILISSFSFFSISSFFWENPFQYTSLIIMITGLLLVIFYLVNPIIRFVKKESGGWLSFLYFIQNLFLIIFLLGMLFKIESYPYANEMILTGFLSFILLIVIPHIELRRIDASRLHHIIVILINLSLISIFLGMFPKLDSRRYGTEILLISRTLSFLLLLIIGLLYLRINKNKRAIQLYLPRLLFVVYFSISLIPMIFRYFF